MLELKELQIGYKNPLLKQSINLSIDEGQICLLLGRNGAGKSTLLKTISGLAKPLSGNILLNGKDLQTMSEIQRSRSVSFLSFRYYTPFPMRVREWIELSRSPHTNWIHTVSSYDSEIIRKAISTFQLSKLLDSFISEVSDGEFQRIQLACAYIQKAQLVLLDEPSAFLDFANRKTFLNHLSHWKETTNNIIIFSSHDWHSSLEVADVVIFIDHHSVLLMRDKIEVLSLYNRLVNESIV